MPQFDFANVFVPQFVWLVLFFGLLYFGIVKATLPRLGRVMTKRDDTVRGDILAAEAAKDDADQMAVDYATGIATAREDARVALASAKTQAAKSIEAKLAKANGASAAKIAEAQVRIDAMSAAAMAEIETVVTEAAQAIVARLTGIDSATVDARSAAKVALARTTLVTGR